MGFIGSVFIALFVCLVVGVMCSALASPTQQLAVIAKVYEVPRVSLGGIFGGTHGGYWEVYYWEPGSSSWLPPDGKVEIWDAYTAENLQRLDSVELTVYKHLNRGMNSVRVLGHRGGS